MSGRHEIEPRKLFLGEKQEVWTTGGDRDMGDDLAQPCHFIRKETEVRGGKACCFPELHRQ